MAGAHQLPIGLEKFDGDLVGQITQIRSEQAMIQIDTHSELNVKVLDVK
jgi:hypothetical protein